MLCFAIIAAVVFTLAGAETTADMRSDFDSFGVIDTALTVMGTGSGSAAPQGVHEAVVEVPEDAETVDPIKIARFADSHPNGEVYVPPPKGIVDIPIRPEKPPHVAQPPYVAPTVNKPPGYTSAPPAPYTSSYASSYASAPAAHKAYSSGSVHKAYSSSIHEPTKARKATKVHKANTRPKKHSKKLPKRSHKGKNKGKHNGKKKGKAESAWDPHHTHTMDKDIKGDVDRAIEKSAHEAMPPMPDHQTSRKRSRKPYGKMPASKERLEKVVKRLRTRVFKDVEKKAAQHMERKYKWRLQRAAGTHASQQRTSRTHLMRTMRKPVRKRRTRRTRSRRDRGSRSDGKRRSRKHVFHAIKNRARRLQKQVAQDKDKARRGKKEVAQAAHLLKKESATVEDLKKGAAVIQEVQPLQQSSQKHVSQADVLEAEPDTVVAEAEDEWGEGRA